MQTTRLNNSKKQFIARKYALGNITQTDLAQQYGVSRKTIYRALHELGVLTPRVSYTRQQQEMFATLKEWGMNTVELKRVLSTFYRDDGVSHVSY